MYSTMITTHWTHLCNQLPDQETDVIHTTQWLPSSPAGVGSTEVSQRWLALPGVVPYRNAIIQDARLYKASFVCEIHPRCEQLWAVSHCFVIDK